MRPLRRGLDFAAQTDYDVRFHPMTRFFVLAAVLVAGLFPLPALCVQMLSAGQAESDKCDQEINAITADFLSKYANSLAEMQIAYQKAADLEAALTVRAELNRVKAEQTLKEESFVAEPKALKDLQAQTYSKIREFSAQILLTHIPKLTELKKKLTIDGDLDGAVAV